ncbi:MAG: DUF2490 domain-containing protein [Candidatus Omnitrophica bacterium]|nr:DUF2490 domain-containing protein [Candidatus Omnitrophota bacterium]
MKKVIGSFVLLFIFSFFGLACAYDDHDFQVWNTDVVEWGINKKAKLSFEQEFRWGDNAGEFYYQHYDIGLSYRLNKNWGFGGGYRDIYELQSNIWRQSNEPYLTATYFLDKFGFSFDSRNRLEYRNFDYKTDSWRYRNKFRLKLPWKFTGLHIQPYVADEIFAQFASSGTTQIHQNRLYGGLGVDMFKNFRVELYYMLKSDKGTDGEWIESNVLGTNLKLSF